MTDYTVIGKYRNRDAVRALIAAIRARGKSCYDFSEKPADPIRPHASAEEQMKALESHSDFLNDSVHKDHFERDLQGLKGARTVVLLLPAGTSAHIEAGIAFGLGKKLILIGKPEKPETLYYIFDQFFETVEEFLETV
ncbi:MAG: hypothetical protein ACREGH_04420 [Minisyncoccia bacterium]